jgi:hypothetical protein
MNRALPPGDCGHRSADPSRASGPAGAMLGTCGLVGGTDAAAYWPNTKASEGNQRTEADPTFAANFLGRPYLESLRLWQVHSHQPSPLPTLLSANAV